MMERLSTQILIIFDEFVLEIDKINRKNAFEEAKNNWQMGNKKTREIYQTVC